MSANYSALRIETDREPRDWDAFDSLPLEVKEMAWYAPFATMPSPKLAHMPIEARKARLEYISSLETRMTYGPDHPQAAP